MRQTIVCFLTLLTIFGSADSLQALDFSRIPLANGFDIPVGQNGKSYYKARGVRPNGHLGEDWNGAGGGDTDMGDPIYATANGIVVFCQDYRMGWGNVVILRHAYLEGGDVKYVDSLYGHLLDFNVSLGQQVKRGQQIARMGNNRGMYDAHLHFEMRKNITVGMYRNSFPRDYSVYWDPTDFVSRHRTLPGGSRLVEVPVNTFSPTPPPVLAGARLDTPAQGVARAGLSVVDNTLISRGRNLSGAGLASVPGNAARSGVSAASYAATNLSASLQSAGVSRVGVREKLPTTVKTAAVSKPVPASRMSVASAESEEPEPVLEAPLVVRKQTPIRRPEFRVNRFEDMRSLGYE